MTEESKRATERYLDGLSDHELMELLYRIRPDKYPNPDADEDISMAPAT